MYVFSYMQNHWGHGSFSMSVAVHNQALQYFLGVHKYVPVAAVSGDMGWEPCEVQWKVCTAARLQNRLLDMSDNRLTKKIFNWDKQQT